MSAKYKSPSFLLPNELNTSANPANDTGVNSLYSMDFDGGSETISLNTSTISFADSFSISMWINPSSLSGFQMLFSGSGYSGGSAIGHYIYNNTVRTYASASGSATQIFQSSALLSTGSWTHIVIQREKGTNWEMWIDGVLEETNTSARLTDDLTSANSTIAKHYNNSSYNFNGKIDEVAIFNRALDSTEIAALYGGTSPNIYPSNIMASNLNPIAYYPLGEQAQNSGYPSATGNEWQFPNGVLQDYVMDFDGSTDYIDAGSSAGVVGTGVRTFSMWLKTSNTGGQTILSTRNQSTDDGWVIQITSTTVQFFNEKNNKMIYTTLSPTLSNGSWHNVVIIRGGSTATNAIYVDGNSINLTINTENGTSPESSSNLSIGSTITSSSTPGFFNGELSNLAIWNSDQSTNIDNIYNNGSPQTAYTVTPQNWWKLNADSVYTPSAPNYTKALDFVASESDYIDAGSSIGLIGTGVRTFSVWLKTSSNAIQTILGTRNVNTDGWVIQWNGPSTGVLFYRPGGVNNGIYSTTGNAANLTDGNWHHLVIVRAGTGNNKIYVDGVSQTLNTAFGDENLTDPQSSKNLLIGAGYTTGGALFRYFDGEISNLAIYNSALSASQVSTLFNFGTPETNISFSPQAWWKLDDQNAITDSSGNGYTGTNNGATDISSGVAVTPSWKIPSALTIPTVNYTTALDFNRSEYDNLNTTAVTDFDTGDVSFSVWVFKDDSSTSGMVFSNSFNSGKAGITVAINDLERVSIKRSTRTHAKDSGYRNFGFTTNKWHQIAFTYNDSTHTLRTFLDGQFKQEFSAPSATLVASTDVCVGGRGPGATNAALFFDGKISNLTIFNSKLEDSDINTLYNSGQPLSDLSSFTTLATWWKLDNLTTGIQDSAGSINLTNDGATQVTSDVYAENIPVNGVSTTLPSTALQQSDLQFDSPYSNYSLSFDGTGDYIDCGAISQIPSATNLTVSCWLNANIITTNQVVWGDDSSSYIFSFEFAGTANKMYFEYAPGYASIALNSVITVGTWHHVVMVYDASGSANTDKIKFYIDGVDKSSSMSYFGNIPLSLSPSIGDFLIGYGTAYSKYFNGNIDETSIFNYSLSEAQVLEIYNNGRPKDLSTFSGTAPISWWRLGENAYFDNNSFVVPNSITGAPNGVGSGTITTMISADAPGTYANGIGTNLDILDRVGDAPLSTSNSQSYNMIPSDISPYVPAYVGNQIANNFSMTFDGVNDYFTTGNTFSTFDGLSKLSISMWVKWDNVSSYRILASVTRDSNANNFVWMLCNIDNHLRFFASTTSEYCYSNYVLTANTWTHVAVTMDKTQSTQANKCKIFINGVDETLNNTNNINSSPLQTSNSPLYIGENQNGKYNPMLGEIDEVAIFDTALNAGQIYNDIYQPTATGTNQTADFVNNPNLPNPVAWYRMGD